MIVSLFCRVFFVFLFCLLMVWRSAFPQEQPEKARLPSKEALPSVSNPASKEAAQAEERLLTNIRQVTFAGQRAGEGYFSQDGQLLVFQSEREPGNPFYQIYTLDLTTGGEHRVSPGHGKATCGWIHLDKQHALFASTHLDPEARKKQKQEFDARASGEKRRYAWDFDEHYDLFETSLTGGALTNLTHARGYDAEASWSPDGALIVFASNRHAFTETLSENEQKLFKQDASSQVDIYLMNADGAQVRRLTNTLGYDGGPFFSADGRKICWRRFTPDGATAEIWMMNIDGSEQRQLTHLGVMSWAPYFHPSSDYVIFATNLQGFGNFELYMVDADGKSQPVRVTYTDGFDSLPAFSPNAKLLTWTSTRTPDKKAQIFFAEWNDAEARQLLGLPEKKEPAVLIGADLPAHGPMVHTLPAIRADDLRLHVEALASEKIDGRLTGTEGERAATEYVANVFRSLGSTPTEDMRESFDTSQAPGFVPAGEGRSFFQPFPFTAGVSLGTDNQLTFAHKGNDEQGALLDTDWRPLAFSKTGSIAPADIVFAGYGIVAPSTDGQTEYDSYVHLDVKDKWVLMFRYLPENVSPEMRQHLNRYAPLRYKAMAARDRGARGLIVVSGPNAQVKEQLVPLLFDSSLAGTSIAAIAITDKIAETWMQAAGKTLKELQDTLDTGAPIMGFLIPETTLSTTIDIQQEKRTGRNVLARLQAGPTPGKTAIVVGAHVDHLGHGIGASSLAREEEKGHIHFGADDNASGVAGMLEIAQYLIDLKARGQLRLKHDIVFAAWSGEEMGLLGSSYFTRTLGGQAIEPASLRPAIAACLNMDMIGRLDKSLIVQGLGSSSVWPTLLERANALVGLPITVQNDSYLPTDATSFYLKEVPILNAFTGAHADYHTPRDTAEKLNYAGAEKITRLFASVAIFLATQTEALDYRKMEQPAAAVGRVGVRAYLGTIPDYAQSDVTGVKLSGVVKGGPAEKAGVQGGDIVVELAGKKIENIYDYTYALDGLKIGAPVELSVLRGEQRVTLTVTPGSRE